MTMATTQANRQTADPSLPARIREFHERLPLVGTPPNAVLRRHQGCPGGLARGHVGQGNRYLNRIPHIH
jgi:hypothetical protein